MIKLASASLRVSALASRFIFAVVGAFFMTADEFGVYGLVATGSYVIAQIAGLEAAPVVLRRIAQQSGPSRCLDQRFYGRLLLITGAAAFALGLAFASWFDWALSITLCCGGIVLLEYWGIEASRILVVERRVGLAMVSVSMRFLPWSIGFPISAAIGFYPAPWSVEHVLLAWLLSSAASLLCIAPAIAAYYGSLPPGFGRWLTILLRGSPKWVIIALCSRFLESGLRMVPGFVIDEAAAGRFVFISTLAATGGIAIRSVIEPIYFTRMITPDQSSEARREFGRITAAGLIGSAVGVAAVWHALPWLSGKENSGRETIVLVLMLASSSLLCLAQVPHFKLYAENRDREVLIISAWVLAGSIPLVLGLTLTYGILGSAIGAVACSAVFAIWKALLVR